MSEDSIPPPDDQVPLPELKYFMHDFENAGAGHKFSEVLMGLYFAKKNGLQYVFNVKTFVRNYRHADLQWLGDLLRKRYPVPREWESNDAIFDMDWKQWIPVYHYWNTTANVYAYTQMTDPKLLQGPPLGFGGRNAYLCPDNNPKSDPNCFMTEFSFFNATRDLQDLLQTTGTQVERLAIHIRLGDIKSSERPETYVKVIEGVRRKLSITLPDDQIHFVYYQPPKRWWRWWSDDHDRLLRDLKQTLPRAHYHDIESVEETVRFFVASEYMMTSGSSLSYLAAYFCVHCHVISTTPKEHLAPEVTEEHLRKNFYFMDEWTPYTHYL
ncbi:hypothetical protein BGZ70_006327 [Mortierella alpina]|uniref:Uncharacterized protein n=1 Tax=Mortierella alpina TaxID=64518 RepID=A0A9P6J7X7_MORAP|nr:hypothetical protein BGZ70_006327 [Mortierella alpina]